VDFPARRALRALLGCLLPLAVFTALSAVYVPGNPLETDEGFYGLAARSASQGQLVYRDFPFNQTHVFPYLHGLLLHLIGFGLFTHRALCAVYAGLALALVAGAAVTARRAFAYGLLAWALALSPFFVARMALGQSFSMAALLLTLMGALSVWTPRPAPRRWWLAVLGALAIGCKLTVAPAVVVLWAYEAWSTRSRWALLAPLLVSAAVFLPVVLPAPEQWWFWNVGFHLGLEAIDFRSAEAYRDHLRMAPGVLLLGLAMIAMAWRRGLRSTPAFAAVIAALGAWILQLPLRSTQGEYAILFLPLLALGTAELLTQLQPQGMQRMVGALALLGVLTGLPPRDLTLRPELEQTAGLLRTEVPLTAPLLTPLPVVALQSGHPVLPGLEMCPFCVTTELEAGRAAELGLHTPRSLIEAVKAGTPGAIAFTGEPSTWDFYWSIPSLNPVPEKERAALFAAIAGARFHPALRNAQFSVWLKDPARRRSPPFWAPRK